MDYNISIRAVIDVIEDFPHGNVWNVEQMEEMIDRIKQLPPAEPKKGKWFYQKGMIKCDQCLRAIRRIDHDGILNFCPNCGSDMREVTE